MNHPFGLSRHAPPLGRDTTNHENRLGRTGNLETYFRTHPSESLIHKIF
jgi:hypothetical protein